MNEMMKLVSFRVSSQILQETIDGEVVIINMMTGSYYSLTGTGAEIFERVVEGFSTEGICKYLLQKYDADSEAVQASVVAMLDRLKAEDILEETTEDEGDSGAEPEPVVIEAKQPFEAPVLQKHDDMQELLRVDPIHDVDSSGWPNIKDAA